MIIREIIELGLFCLSLGLFLYIEKNWMKVNNAKK
jgi:hypothetical protein